MQIEFSRPFIVLLLRCELQSNMASLVWPKSRNFLGDGPGLGLGWAWDGVKWAKDECLEEACPHADLG